MRIEATACRHVLPRCARRRRSIATRRRVRTVADPRDLGPRHQARRCCGERPAADPRSRLRQLRRHPEARDAAGGHGRVPGHGQQDKPIITVNRNENYAREPTRLFFDRRTETLISTARRWRAGSACRPRLLRSRFSNLANFASSDPGSMLACAGYARTARRRAEDDTALCRSASIGEC